MATTQRRIDRGTQRGSRLLLELGREVREARSGAGLSQLSAGAAAGMSHTKVSRIETGAADNVALLDLARLAAAVGLDLSLRAYPGPGPVRDAAHLRLLARLRDCLAPTLGWRTEVPLSIHGDQRAWDAVIVGAGPPIAVEAETRLRDVQALERRIAVKMRDAGVDRAIILLGDTATNREALRAHPNPFSGSFPVTARIALGALRRGVDPGGSAVVLL